ncbi:MAG: hypothetical protein GYA18_06480 [Chloroflexi bacterium]|nr:hypothetical protein [Chloroflexota bacterium]
MSKIMRLIKHEKNMWIPLANIFIVACLAHHVFSIWDKKAIWIFLTFLFCYPLFIWISFKVFPRINKAFQLMKNKQYLFIISAFFLSLFATRLFYQTPKSYQTITITPEISRGQKVELLEIKATGDILDLNEEAKNSEWFIDNGILTATHNSRPLIYTVQVPVNSKVSILFNSSPEEGSISLSYGSIRKEINLFETSQQQRLVTLSSQYRSIPNWLFLPFLITADIFTFFVFFLGIFIFQERGQQYLVENPREKFISKRQSIIILVILSTIFNLINALTIPLIVDSDTPAYLQGAVHLLKYGNLNGVSMFCGPGTTFLFAPILLIFGRNPWGMKILLHLLALGCVLVNYRLGWQLSKKRWIAFIIGLVTILIPDIYYYSNFVMSDLPNIFLILLFSSLLLDALEDSRFQKILSALLVGSFATLLRTENILILLFGAFCLGINPGLDLIRGVLHKKTFRTKHTNISSLGILLLTLIIALMPILLWSAHNYKLHGFFGLNDSSSVVLYGGWIYYPEASGLKIQDKSSSAIREINQCIDRYPIEITDSSGVATPGEIYPSMIKCGYSTEEIFDIFEQAALDSIFSHKELIPTILKIKLRDAFKPEIIHTATFPLNDEIFQPNRLYADYFDVVTLSFPKLISAQRALYDLFNDTLSKIYRVLIMVALFTMLLSLYRKSFLNWAMLAFFASTRIFIPNLISVSNWRYTVSGILPLTIFGVISLAVLIYGTKDIIKQS